MARLTLEDINNELKNVGINNITKRDEENEPTNSLKNFLEECSLGNKTLSELNIDIKNDVENLKKELNNGI